MINPVSIGKKIAKERETLELSQNELSALVFVTPQAISKWENGLSVPSVEALARLTKIFSISVDELLFDSNNKNLEKLFSEHSREYVVDMVLTGRVDVELVDSLHLFGNQERLIILRSLLERNDYEVLRSCWHLLSIGERIYVYNRMDSAGKGSLYLSSKEITILKRRNQYEL